MAAYAFFRVNSLGDNVIFLNSIQHVRRLAPSAHLVVLTNTISRELYEGIPEPITVLTFEKSEYFQILRQPLRLLKLLLFLRKLNIDGSIVGDDQPNVSLLLARLAGGTVRVGGYRTWHKIPGALTSRERQDGRSMTHWSWEIARVFCREALGETLPLEPSPPDLDHLRDHPAPARQSVVIHPGASMEYKRWPSESFRELARRLSSRYHVLWIESPEVSSEGLSAAVEKVQPESLRALVSLLDRAALFIGNNSGPMHLAAALGVNSLVINGPTDPAWNPVWNLARIRSLRNTTLSCVPCDVLANYPGRCINEIEPMGCMKAWDADTVFSIAETQLRHAGKPSFT